MLIIGELWRTGTFYWLRRRRIVAEPSHYDFSLVKSARSVFIVFSPREIIYPQMHILTFTLLFSLLWGLSKE